MISRALFEFSVPAHRARSMLPPAFGASHLPNDELITGRIIAAPGLRPVVAFEKWVPSDQRLLAQVGVIEAKDPSDLLRPPHLVEFKPRPDPGPIAGRWLFAGVGDVPPELLFRLAHWLSGSRPWNGFLETTVESEAIIIRLGTLNGAPFEYRDPADPGGRIPPSAPCTEAEHRYPAGFATCQCGAALRTGDCRLGKVEARGDLDAKFTVAERYEQTLTILQPYAEGTPGMLPQMAQRVANILARTQKALSEARREGLTIDAEGRQHAKRAVALGSLLERIAKGILGSEAVVLQDDLLHAEAVVEACIALHRSEHERRVEAERDRDTARASGKTASDMIDDIAKQLETAGVPQGDGNCRWSIDRRVRWLVELHEVVDGGTLLLDRALVTAIANGQARYDVEPQDAQHHAHSLALEVLALRGLANSATDALGTISLRLDDIATVPHDRGTRIRSQEGVSLLLKRILSALEVLRRQQPTEHVRQRLAQIAGLSEKASIDDAITVIDLAAQHLRNENQGRRFPRNLATLDALAQGIAQDVKVLTESADGSEIILKEIRAITGLVEVPRAELAAGVRALLQRYNRDADIVSAIDRLAARLRSSPRDSTVSSAPEYRAWVDQQTPPDTKPAPFLMGNFEFRHHGRLVEIRARGSVRATLLVKSVPSDHDPLRVGPFTVRCTTCTAWRPAPHDSPSDLIRHHLDEAHSVADYEWSHRPAHASDWVIPLE